MKYFIVPRKVKRENFDDYLKENVSQKYPRIVKLRNWKLLLYFAKYLMDFKASENVYFSFILYAITV